MANVANFPEYVDWAVTTYALPSNGKLVIDAGSKAVMERGGTGLWVPAFVFVSRADVIAANASGVPP